MPKTFAITPVKSRLTLDANGEARVTFNVSNTSDQALRARVTPVALQSAQRSWLSVEGDAERSFSADQTHQFTVRIAVPPETAAGDFSLRLDCAATHNPDELFTEGPVVAFERPEVKPPPPPIWPWLVAAAVLLLVVGAAVWWFVLREDLTMVPDLTGLSTEQGIVAIQAAGLTLGNFEFRASTNEERAKIVAQEPAAQGQMPVGGAVDVWVGSGPRAVGPISVVNVLSTADIQSLQQFKHKEAVRRLLEPEKPDNQ